MKKISKLTILSLFIIPLFSSCDGINSSVQNSLSESYLEETTSSEGDFTSSEEESSFTTEISSEESSQDTSTQISEGYPERFAIYSINDTHGAISEDSDSSTYIPGMANLDYSIKSDPDYDENFSVILSAGDMSQGTGISNISRGQCMMECMNAMGIDAMALGNHEFDWGVDVIDQMKETADFPFLGINILNEDDGKIIDQSQASTIIEKGSLKIGVVGSIYRYIKNSISASQIEGIEFVDDEPLVTSEVERLKEEEKCDVVVVLTHQGGNTSAVSNYLTDSNISGIFGGHNHAFSCDISSDNNRYFLEAGSSSRAYSKLVLTKNSDGSYSVEDGETNYIYENECINASSPEIESIEEKYLSLYGDELVEIIGERDAAMNKNQLGTLVTEAMMYYAEEVCQVDDISVAVHNRGGIRTTWTSETKNENGMYDITYDDLFQMMPFDNEVQYVELTGDKMIEACTSYYDYHSKDFTEIDSKYYIDGNEIDESETYKVLAIDYIITRDDNPCYQGGDEGTPINGVVYTRDIIEDYISYLGVVNVDDFPSLV